MKKIIALLSICALTLGVVIPALGTTIDPSSTVITGLTRDTSGGASPIVKAKWEANSDMYTDASTDPGAQIMPSGQYGVNKTIAICAIVTDPDGLADIDNVYADVFYPENIALGSSHVALPNQSGEGCGKLMQEDALAKLSKADGIELFCNKVKNLNNNLPTFNQGYDYAEICATDGELQKETAAVYCGTKNLSYEDPDGSYKVWAVAQDKVGLQGILENHFSYLPLTAFETDFTSVSYGNVRLNTHKIISGNLLWEPTASVKPTVRNVGNTRLSMKVSQDDMGLGMTNGVYNVKYDARVGSAASFANYVPYQTVTLSDALDLSEMDEMDFSIDISKFPPGHASDSYTGNMTLGAVSAAHLTCP
ncbi:MAG: hypothetical protein PHN39_01005 [Candidatus Pacebacteria bacterium]|nr:hypothetical protein [Candidatus Paceibacterota bacterium]